MVAQIGVQCGMATRGRLLERYGMEARPCVLGPPEAFSDNLAPLEPGWWFWPRIDSHRIASNSRTVESRLNQSCCGWIQPPTPREFYEAVHAEELSRRQQTLVYTWGLEALEIEIIHAWAERVYSWRVLVRALHKAHFDVYPRIRLINQYALIGEMNGSDLWTG